MALRDVVLKLGVAKDDTDYGLTGYAIDSQWIRFVNGNVLPQGGYQKHNSASMSGICRGLFEYSTSDGSVYAAFGTHRRLYISSASYLQNITPTASTGTFGNNPFATVSTSKVITVTHAAHGRRDGDWIYIGNSATFNGVTPGGAHGTFAAGAFTTSLNSNVVQITQIGHGMATNDEIIISGASAVGGITPNGTFLIRVLSANTYQIYFGTAATSSAIGGGTPTYIYRRAYEISFVDVNTYTIIDVATASGTGTGGGNAVQYLYELSSGLKDGVSGTGYSTSGWSVGPYSVSFAGSTISFNPRTWSFAKFGDILIANPAAGMIYEWTQNWSMRATQVPNSPANCLYVIVTANRQIIALGCTTQNGNFDPMYMAWCDVEDLTDWTPSQTNNAGNLKLALGSTIVCASSGDSGSIVWTDRGFYNLTFIGDFGQTYRADLIAPNYGICGPNAFIDNGLEVYWVTPRGSFARYRGGAPMELRCRSKKWFAEGISVGQLYKIFAFYDQRYPAFSVLFPKTTNECDTYLRFDFGEETADGAGGWSSGTVDRTAWLDSEAMIYPLAVTSTGIIYEQEHGNSADGNNLTRSIEFREVITWADQFGNSDRVLNLNKVIPQATVMSGSLGFFFDFRRYPNGPVVTKPKTGMPFAWTNATEFIPVRGQGRSVSIRIQSSSTNDNWTLGNEWKADVSAGPRR